MDSDLVDIVVSKFGACNCIVCMRSLRLWYRALLCLRMSIGRDLHESKQLHVDD